MTRIGVLSDTHSFLDPTLQKHFEACDEIWHAGDFGDVSVIDDMADWGKEMRLVYGNIDDHLVRRIAPKDLLFEVEGISVLMTHIAGYPGRYNKRVKALIAEHRPGIVVCGHSHILKVIYDKQFEHLHINPGAAGRHGFHKVRTAIRFTVKGRDISDMQVIELGQRGRTG